MLESDTIAAEKKALRERIRRELKSLTDGERAADSLKACERLEAQPVWKAAQSILFYAPMADEVDIWRLLADAQKAGRTILLPRYDAREKRYFACHVRDAERELRTGQFGILEPEERCATISSNRLDLILVPGLAFDLDGRRLGRGKGFYDQLLSALQGPTCGVGFDRQIVSHIPTEPHDIRLNYILTPTRWHSVKEPRAVLK